MSTSIQRILLCPPDHYDIKYEINPWMDMSVKVNKDNAREEHNTLKAVYTSLNVPFNELTPDAELPDQVFATDVGHAEGKNFIKANFKYKERRREADIAEEYFKNLGYTIHVLPEKNWFEGGDFLKIGDKYFYGWGKRSSLETIPHIEKVLKTKIIPIELPDPYFYHLDTCFSPLSEDIALVHAGAFTPEGLRTIQKHFKTIVSTAGEDNAQIACNFVPIGKNIIISEGVSHFLKNVLRHLGFIIHPVPMTEYIKGGGSIHCLSLEIWG